MRWNAEELEYMFIDRERRPAPRARGELPMQDGMGGGHGGCGGVSVRHDAQRRAVGEAGGDTGADPEAERKECQAETGTTGSRELRGRRPGDHADLRAVGRVREGAAGYPEFHPCGAAMAGEARTERDQVCVRDRAAQERVFAHPYHPTEDGAGRDRKDMAAWVRERKTITAGEVRADRDIKISRQGPARDEAMGTVEEPEKTDRDGSGQEGIQADGGAGGGSGRRGCGGAVRAAVSGVRDHAGTPAGGSGLCAEHHDQAQRVPAGRLHLRAAAAQAGIGGIGDGNARAHAHHARRYARTEEGRAE